MSKLRKKFLLENSIFYYKNIPYFNGKNDKNIRKFEIIPTYQIMKFNPIEMIYKLNSRAINLNGREIIDCKSFENIYTKREEKINKLIEENNSSVIKLTSPSEIKNDIYNLNYSELSKVEFHHVKEINQNIVNFIYIWWKDKNYVLYRNSLNHQKLPKWLFTTDYFDTPKSMISLKKNWLKACNNEKSLDQVLIDMPKKIKEFSLSDKSLKFYYQLEIIDSHTRLLNNLINETNKGMKKLIEKIELIDKINEYKSIEIFLQYNNFTIIFLDDIKAKNFDILLLIINDIKGGKDWIINYDKKLNKKNNLILKKITSHFKFIELNGNYIDEWTLNNLKEYHILGKVNYVKKYLRKNIFN